MRTRSQSREQRPPPPEGPPVVIEPLRIEYPFQEDPPFKPMADNRIWALLLISPSVGYEDAILNLKLWATIYDRAEAYGLINTCPEQSRSSVLDKEDTLCSYR
ncbi:hypothetical protein Tco_0671915 [Tanacetum coccineum]